jgi:hypothetical protein
MNTGATRIAIPSRGYDPVALLTDDEGGAEP